MADFAIETNDLRKSFKRNVEALRGLNMRVPAGAVYGLVGRNGAGKTTAIRCLMGLLRPTSGNALVLGCDMMRASWEHRSRVAYVSQQQQLYPGMTLEQLGNYVADFYPNWDRGFARDLAHRFELTYYDREIGQMSGGEQRKAAMVLAFAARSEVLILDEPAAGLDPIARSQFLDAIVQILSEGDARTVLLSSHILSDLERVADTIGIMRPGEMLWEASLQTMQERARTVQVIFPGEVPKEFTVPGAVKQRCEGAVVTALVMMNDPGPLDALRREAGLRVSEFPVPLEELFVELLGPQSPGQEISNLEVRA